MASWKKTIATPFKKLFNPPTQPRDTKPHQGHVYDNRIMDLQGEVMACGYEDVQVMWSILDKSKQPKTACNMTS